MDHSRGEETHPEPVAMGIEEEASEPVAVPGACSRQPLPQCPAHEPRGGTKVGLHLDSF